MKKLLLPTITILSLLLSDVGAQYVAGSKYYPVDITHSELRFSIAYMKFGKVSGAFTNAKGVIFYDRENPLSLSGTFTIDVNTLNTGNEGRDNDLKKSWFEVEKFPNIYFHTEKVAKAARGYQLSGTITIKNISKPITIYLDQIEGPVKDIRLDEFAVFQGSAKLNRKDFGINRTNWDGVVEGITGISDEVAIEFTIMGKQAKEKNYAGRFNSMTTQSGLLYNSIKNLTSKERIESVIDSLVNAKAIIADIGFFTVSNYYLMQSNTDRAKIILEKGDQLYPKGTLIKEGLIELYKVTKDQLKLKNTIDELLRLDPNNPQAVEYSKR